MDNVKVSVIVPVYNASEYIGNTLNSIINQNFDGYEIIVIDDGSTDGSLEIINTTLENIEIPHKIIHQENAGVSVARNVGIEACKGDYLVFIDADDHVTPNHLSTLYDGKSDFSLILYVKEDGDKLIPMDTYAEKTISTEDFIKKELNMEITFNFFQLMYNTIDSVIVGNYSRREKFTARTRSSHTRHCSMEGKLQSTTKSHITMSSTPNQQ